MRQSRRRAFCFIQILGPMGICDPERMKVRRRGCFSPPGRRKHFRTGKPNTLVGDFHTANRLRARRSVRHRWNGRPSPRLAPRKLGRRPRRDADGVQRRRAECPALGLVRPGRCDHFGPAVFSVDATHLFRPFARCDARFGRLRFGRLMTLRTSAARRVDRQGLCLGA